MRRFIRLAGLFICLFGLLTHIEAIAQEGEPEQETIYVMLGHVSYVKLPANYKNGVSISPKDFADYFDVTYLTTDGSLTITPKKMNPEPGLLNIQYKSAFIQLKIVYKENVQPGEDAFTLDISEKYKDINTEIINTPLSLLKSNEVLRNLKKQDKPMPLATAELYRLYPGVKFDDYPSNQTINLAASKTSEMSINADNLKYIEASKNSLYFGSDEIPVNLGIQGISYLGTDAFMKVLIQNNSNQNFLTGAMMLTLKRKDGKDIKLHPAFIMPSPPYLPLILPGSEIVIIYCFKAYSVLDEDQLKFELHDRQNKVNLEFLFSGKSFNEF